MEFLREKLQDILEEFKPIYEAHAKLTASHQDLFPVQPDWPGYAKVEELGWLHIQTVRDNGNLIGYMWFMTGPNFNWPNNKIAVMEKYYVKPEYWGKGIGSKLQELVDIWAKEMGCVRAFGSTKISQGNAPERMMTKNGYTPIEKNWEKVL